MFGKVSGQSSRENVSVGYSPIALLLKQYPILVLQEPDSCLHLLPSFPPLAPIFVKTMNLAKALLTRAYKEAFSFVVRNLSISSLRSLPREW